MMADRSVEVCCGVKRLQDLPLFSAGCRQTQKDGSRVVMSLSKQEKNSSNPRKIKEIRRRAEWVPPTRVLARERRKVQNSQPVRTVPKANGRQPVPSSWHRILLRESGVGPATRSGFRRGDGHSLTCGRLWDGRAGGLGDWGWTVGERGVILVWKAGGWKEMYRSRYEGWYSLSDCKRQMEMRELQHLRCVRYL